VTPNPTHPSPDTIRIASEAPPTEAALATADSCAGREAANIALAPDVFNVLTHPVVEEDT
jgi:hypothetical protein